MILRFTLTDYTINENGITRLVEEPVGANGSKIVFKRDVAHGIFFDYTLGDLGFFGDGFSLIRDAWEAKGVLAHTTLLIEAECEEGSGEFDTVYEGKLNYAKIKFNYSDTCLVHIGIENADCLMQFRNRYDQNVDIESLESFDGEALQAYTGLQEAATLPIKDIFEETAFTDGEMDEQQCAEFGTTFSNTPFYLAPSLYNSKNDLKQAFDQINDMQHTIAISSVNLPPIFVPDPGYILPMTVTVDYNFAGDWYDYSRDATGDPCEGALTPSVRSTSATKVYLRLYKGTDLNSADIYDLCEIDAYAGGDNPFTKVFTTSGPQTLTLTLHPGEKIWLHWRFDYDATFTGSLELGFRQVYTVKELSISARSEVPPTEAKVFLINEVLSRITESITNDCMRVLSTYYGRTDSEPYNVDAEGCGSNRFLTNGLMVRRARLNDGSEPKFTISMKTAIDALNCIDCIGVGIEDDDRRAPGFKRIRVERIDFFYEDTLVLLCDNVKEIEVLSDEKRIYSIVKSGYKNFEPDSVGGRDDFHGTREHRTSQDATRNTLDAVSDFIASNYVLEKTRRVGNGTDDWRYDPSIFICTFARNGYSMIDVDSDFFPNAGQNLIAITYFNQSISPIRNLMRWMRVITVAWSRQFASEDILLKFTNGEANYIAKWRKTANDDCLLEDQSELLPENLDVSKNDFKSTDDCKPLFEPELIKFTYPITYQQLRSIRQRPYRLVRVTQGSRTLFGWIVEMQYELTTGLTDFTLIRKYVEP